DLAGRVVDVGALVFDLRDVADDGEAVREAFGDVNLLEVLRRDADTDPFAERRRPAPDVDSDIEDLAFDDAKELALRVRQLQMKATDGATRRSRVIVLDEDVRDAAAPVFVGVIRLEKKAAAILMDVGL